MTEHFCFCSCFMRRRYQVEIEFFFLCDSHSFCLLIFKWRFFAHDIKTAHGKKLLMSNVEIPLIALLTCLNPSSVYVSIECCTVHFRSSSKNRCVFGIFIVPDRKFKEREKGIANEKACVKHIQPHYSSYVLSQILSARSHAVTEVVLSHYGAIDGMVAHNRSPSQLTED